MISIANELRDGNSINNSVVSASLTMTQNDAYNPRILRQKIALLIDTHRPCMITTLTRRRRQQLQQPIQNQRHVKRRKQLQKISNSKQDIIQIA